MAGNVGGTLLVLAVAAAIVCATLVLIGANLLMQDAINEKWMALEAVILSGQMPDKNVQDLMREDPDFAEWLTERAEKRQDAASR